MQKAKRRLSVLRMWCIILFANGLYCTIMVGFALARNAPGLSMAFVISGTLSFFVLAINNEEIADTRVDIEGVRYLEVLEEAEEEIRRLRSQIKEQK